MNAYILIIAAVLLLAVGLGGSFVGGVLVGNGQAEEAPVVSFPTPTVPTAPTDSASPVSPSVRLSGDQIADLMEQLRSGDLSPEELAQLRQQFQAQSGAGRGTWGSGGLAGRRGLQGTIESIDGNTVTISTPQGTLSATVGEDTAIRITSEGSIGDLATGMRVSVSGERGENGVIAAQLISVVPPWLELPFGGSSGGPSGQVPH